MDFVCFGEMLEDVEGSNFIAFVRWKWNSLTEKKHILHGGIASLFYEYWGRGIT
jgi:hypothetical protein